MYTREKIESEFTAVPTVQQLHALAGLTLGLAREQDKIKDYRDNKNYRAQEYVFDSINQDILEEGVIGYTSLTYSGKFERRGTHKTRYWNMRLLERFWSYRVEDRVREETSRTSYRFVWTPDEVIASERRIQTASATLNPDPDIYHDLLSIDRVYQISEIRHAYYNLGRVSLSDMDLMIGDVINFIEVSQNHDKEALNI